MQNLTPILSEYQLANQILNNEEERLSLCQSFIDSDFNQKRSEKEVTVGDQSLVVNGKRPGIILIYSFAQINTILSERSQPNSLLRVKINFQQRLTHTHIMGAECACLGQDAIKAQALEKEHQNSKFFYYSDPKLLASFQEKLNQIQKTIGSQHKQRSHYRSGQGGASSGEQSHLLSHEQTSTRASRRHGKQKSQSPEYKQPWSMQPSQASQQLQQIESLLQKENQNVIQSLQVERLSGWNDALPSRLILEVGQVSGLWNTSETWFTQCRSMIQVEYAGTCINSRPQANMRDPYFAELFIFPVSQESLNQLNEGVATKVFITVFSVEGKSDIPVAAELEYDEFEASADRNIYKRVAEYCLDISEIRADQLVHQLTLSLPVKSGKPKPGPLFHTLRNCNISGLLNDSIIHSPFSEISTPQGQPKQQQQEYFSQQKGTRDRKKPAPMASHPRDWYEEPKTALLPVYAQQKKRLEADFSILDIMKEMDEPARLKEANDGYMGQTGQRNQRVGSVNKIPLMGPTPRGAQTRPHQRQSPPKPAYQSAVDPDFKQYGGNRTTRASLVSSKKNGGKEPLTLQTGCRTARRVAKACPEGGAETISSTQRALKTQRFARAGNEQHSNDADDFSNQVQTVATTQESSSRFKVQRQKTVSPEQKNPFICSTRESPELSCYQSTNRLELDTYGGGDMKRGRIAFLKTLNQERRLAKKNGFAELEPTASVQDSITKGDSPVKAVRCEEALAKPCRSFSFDDNFALDSDIEQGTLDDNWSPVAMGDAKVSLDNRVSPLKNRHESQLLGGLHPVKTQWSPSKLTKNGSTGVAPFDLGMGKGTAGMLTAEEATMAATSDIVKVSLRIQFMHNAQDHLLSYREKLQKANDIMKSIDLNKQV